AAMHVPVALSDEDSVSQDGPPQLSPQQQQPSNLVADRFRELQESSAADADSPHNGNDDDENSVDRKPFDDVDPEGTLSANSSIQQTPTPTNGSPTSRPLRRRTGDSDDDEEEPGGSSLRQSNFGADAASAADEEIRVTKFEPPTVLSSPQLLAANPAASTSAAALPLTSFAIPAQIQTPQGLVTVNLLIAPQGGLQPTAGAAAAPMGLQQQQQMLLLQQQLQLQQQQQQLLLQQPTIANVQSVTSSKKRPPAPPASDSPPAKRAAESADPPPASATPTPATERRSSSSTLICCAYLRKRAVAARAS
ncbi:hypothetical protein BOX15_Mlig012948g2, partial [Macrostomum lignano]